MQKGMIGLPCSNKLGKGKTMEYEVQGNYGYGWDRVTTEDTKAEALAQVEVYRDNERSASFRIVKVKG